MVHRLKPILGYPRGGDDDGPSGSVTREEEQALRRCLK